MNYDANEEIGESNKISSINIFENLKSDYFLIVVFGNLDKKKKLKLINYNKKYKEELI